MEVVAAGLNLRPPGWDLGPARITAANKELIGVFLAKKADTQLHPSSYRLPTCWLHK